MSDRVEFPWDPPVPADICPKAFEELALDWLVRAGNDGKPNLTVTHREVIPGIGGDYEIDIVVRLTILGGAQITILVECKHWSRPVDRDTVITLWGKLDALHAHKGIMFSSSGFQSGALTYATEKAIAAVAIVEGKWLYEARHALPGPAEPPPWVHVDTYVGMRLTADQTRTWSHRIDSETVDALREWLSADPQGGQLT